MCFFSSIQKNERNFPFHVHGTIVVGAVSERPKTVESPQSNISYVQCENQHSVETLNSEQHRIVGTNAVLNIQIHAYMDHDIDCIWLCTFRYNVMHISASIRSKRIRKDAIY